MGIVEKIKEEFETFLFDSVKENLKQEHDTRKIKADIKAYANQRFDSVYETADLENEIDFQGLMQYMETSLLDEVKYSLFVWDAEKAEQYKSMILKKAQEYAKANTSSKQERVTQFIETTLQIARNYYMDRLDGENQIFLNLTAQEIVKSIGRDLKRLEESIKQIKEEIKEEVGNMQIYNSRKIDLVTDHEVIYATQNIDNRTNGSSFSENSNRIKEKRCEYAEHYEEELPPMGDDSVSVSLKQLYIEPEYSLAYPYEGKRERLVFSYLKEFLHSEEKKKKKILFVEGDAGIGKTSLVSKIAYHYEHQNEESKLGKDFFSGMRLICVRLRDMLETSQVLNVENPWKDIFQYLNVAKENQRNESKRQSVLILDGFDELCMVESIQSEKKIDYFINLSRNLQSGRIHWKVIVTSRPNYIGWENLKKDLNDYMEIIQLQHFSIEKRNQWVKRAKEVGLSITQEVELGMVASNREELEAIIGVPWTLYLVTKKAIVITTKANLWEIYNLIFKRENITRSFEEEVHPTRLLQNDLYRITEEVAFWMYENQCFDINPDTIKSLIDRIYKESKQEEKLRFLIQLRDTYALHTYYRKTDQRGGLAFYHNYIQDFFLCEQIFFKLNETYEQLKTLQTTYEQLDYLITCYIYLLSAGYLNENIVCFIQSRIQYECETNQKSMWIQYEQKYSIFVQAFEDMLWYGIGKPDFLRRVKKPVSQVIEILFYNCWKIYGSLYQINNQLILNLFKGGREIFVLPIKSILEILSKSIPLDGMELREVNLKGVNLREVNLNKANLRGVNLFKADLSVANLRGADLREANLNKANLKGANLNKANLKGADMRGADVRGGDVRGANLNKANLRGANLTGADMRGANLTGTDMRGADVRGGDVRGANLDGAILSSYLRI